MAPADVAGTSANNPPDPPAFGVTQAPLAEVGQRSKLSARVAREIVAYIVENRIEPGNALPGERQMIAQLNVSRSTLREALRMLEAHGLIRLKPGPSGGPIVERMDGRQLGLVSGLHFHVAHATFREIWEARVMMEPLMVKAAVERDARAVFERLTEASDRIRDAEGSADEAWISAASDFHTTISAMSGNRVLDLWAVSLAEIWKTHTRGLSFPDDGRHQVSDDHDEIVRAVLDGDADHAYELMLKHNRHMMGYVEERFPGLLDAVVPLNI